MSELYLDPPASVGAGTTALQNASMDALSHGGKRVRAVLALLTCELFSGDYREALPVALAYELAHASALIQDDILDNSSFRRGAESTVAKYGLSNAILASDLLLFHVPKMISMYRGLNSERLCELFDLVGDSCRATTWGEFLDLEMMSSPTTSTNLLTNAESRAIAEKRYEEMIRLKTASLLRAPAASGAIVGGATDDGVSASYRFGEYLGMAYQIQDDLLDLMADEETLGKPSFTDIRNGKSNVVIYYSLNHSHGEDAGFIRELLGRGSGSRYTDSEVVRARSIFSKGGAVDYARAKADRYVEEAKILLGSIVRNSDSDAYVHLLELSDYLAKRYY